MILIILIIIILLAIYGKIVIQDKYKRRRCHMATNQEVKQALRDAIAQDHDSDAAVDAAADQVLALVNDTPAEQSNPVEEAVVEAITTKGLVQTFGEQALVTELEDLGYVVTSPDAENTDFDDSDPSEFDEPITRSR